MRAEQPICFATFRLDPVNERLWRGAELLALRPRPFAVLRYLAAHPGRLVTKEELLEVLWPRTRVSPGVLKAYVRMLRQVLGDDAEAPQFIETVPGRGYRWLAPLTTTLPVRSSAFGVRSREQSSVQHPQPPTPYTLHPTPPLVGRDAELQQLFAWLEKALRGERQVVFVTGEPGIGKTALVDTFLAQVAAQDDLWIGRGQCIDHYGTGEAYLPVFEALGRLCRVPSQGHFLDLLTQHAPTWVLQMPTLLTAADCEALQRKVQGASQERMLREMAEALEALTTGRPLVLVLEDLHWSDAATLDLLSFLARRREAARLLVIGTYRPVDVIVREHPLKTVKQELHLHGHCQELSLAFLTREAVTAYLSGRFNGGTQLPFQELARVIHRRTEGNPLFIVNVLDYAVAQGWLSEHDGQWQLCVAAEDLAKAIPVSVQEMIEKQLDQLTAEKRRILEIASVAGVEFSAAAVAAGLEVDPVLIEEQCEDLARREHFLQSKGAITWPDRTVTARYGFSHALYHDVVYEGIPAGKRVQLHRRIGEREVQGYRDQAQDIAAELAVHFERGQEYWRAVHYRQHAAENTLRRYAPREASEHLTQALALLHALPPTPERTQQELEVQTALGSVLITTKGWGAPEVERAYTQAQRLCQQLGETPQLFSVLWGLWAFHISTGDVRTACRYAEQLLGIAQDTQNSEHLVLAHQAVGAAVYMLGDLTAAQRHLEQGLAFYLPDEHASLTVSYGVDIRVGYLGYYSFTLWSLGYPDQALQKIREALSLAREVAHPHTLVLTSSFATSAYLACGQAQAAQEQVETLLALSRQHGFPYFVTQGAILRGQVLIALGQREEGMAQIREGLVAHRAAGSTLGLVLGLAWLAWACGQEGQIEEGMQVLAEAFTTLHDTGEQMYEADLYRLKGELTLKRSSVQSLASSILNPRSAIRNPQLEAEAEACFRKAIEIARRQGARSLELEAVMSLSRLWYQQGKKGKARRLLADTYGWFTEGFETADLKVARTLLAKMS